MDQKDGCCAVGIGGPYEIANCGLEPGCKYPWHIIWLPNGYGITPDDYCICLVAKPPGEDWSQFSLEKGRRPPLIEAICEAVEKQMKVTLPQQP